MSRNRYLLAGLAVIVLIAVSFPLWSPYFRNDVVDESFPGLSADQRAMIRAMPEDQQAVLVEMSADNSDMATQTAAAAISPDTLMAEEMPEMPAEPVVIGQGAFIEIDPVHRAEGTATVYQIDEALVLRFEDFRVTNGPQLHVVLSKTTPTTIFGGVGEDMIDLGPLKGNVGNQNYDIPAGVDLSEYQSVVIYCVPFGVVFSSAALSAS